jgi:O-acetylhomoserine (thiol)-lyase
MKTETLSIHAGYEVDPTTKAVAVPLYQTTSYAFDDTQHGADLFDLKVTGNIYSRIMNPTNDVLEKRVAALEKGVGALAVASGMAAITYAIQTIAKAGDNIVSVAKLYGGTYNLFAHNFPRIGITTRFAAHEDLTGLEALIDDKTCAVFCETITNPGGNIADITALAEIAHRHGVPLIVDNTVATPVLCRPIDFGADIVVHSLTKYIGGHGTTIGGMIVDSGNFDWEANACRFSVLTTPDPSYHGVTYTKEFGPAAAHNFPRIGITTRFAAHEDLTGLEALIDDKTCAVFCETITNPGGNIADITALAEIAHRHGVPLIVDNTVATPVLCRPIDFGADIVVHSLTKYIGGHGTTIGGMIVDSGNFDWEANACRFSVLTTPDPSYHGVTYTKEFGPAAFIGRCRVGPLRNTGAALSPFNAFMLLQGLETLSLRMERHTHNALLVAEYLEKHPQVAWVKYAGLPQHPDHALANKYVGGKPSAILSFGIVGGQEADTRFIDSLKLIVRLVNIGDAKSLACHPASTTHRQLNDEELELAGVPRDMIRLSVGIEHIDDIIEDLSQALENTRL